MAAIGLSFILASVVYLMIRPPLWLSAYFASWPQVQITPRPESMTDENGDDKRRNSEAPCQTESMKTATRRSEENIIPIISTSNISGATASKERGKKDNISVLPPPPPPTISSSDPEAEEQITPKAGPSHLSVGVPSLNLDDSFSQNIPPSVGIGFMPPPPRPARPPTIVPNPISSLSAASARRGGHIPVRGPGTSTLAPPPTHSSAPIKSRSVTLQPGRSPLDWARISGPSADLRNLPSSTPYLKVTRSQLKKMNGRKGNDAWMALNGKVYNMDPYKEYHPGGVGELFRGAGKDGTKLFGEVHPWVNYETMLQACLVGVLVEDYEVAGSNMDDMD